MIRFRKLTIVALLAFGFLGFLLTLSPPSAAALSGSQFDASYIIDDTIFYDGNAMTTSEVQAFLNAKVPNCDTNGEKRYTGSRPATDYNKDGVIQRWERGKYAGNPKPFICLKNYKQDTPERAAEDSSLCGYLPARNDRSAAAIITDISNACGVSPKVLIVLLQKEQGLVTDEWPWKVQYQKATGYGCPDTAPCNTAYYGFFNQVYKAAWQFKRYRANPDGYRYIAGQNNKIYWNPNSSCGYSWVKIRNQATAGLYIYTPYRPNKAALDNLYGSGNSCSAYGNRNFWRYFNDWFGSSINPLFKIEGSDTVYLNWSGTYYPIPSPEVLKAYGLDNIPIRTVTSSQVQEMTLGQPLSVIATFGSSSTAYFIDDGKYYSIPSMDILNDYGYPGSAIKTFSDANLRSVLSAGKSVTSLARTSSGAIYHINDSKKHLFPDYSTFTSLGPGLTGDSTLKYNTFSNHLLSKITEGSPVLREGSILKSKDSATVYLYDNSTLLPFTYDAWVSWGKQLDYNFLTEASVDQLPVSSSNVPILVTDGTYRYLVDTGQKMRFNTTPQTQWGLDNSQFMSLSAASLGNLKTGANVGTLLGNKAGTVYVLRNNEKLKIPAASDFVALGYSWGQVQRLGNNALDLIPTSDTLALGPGSLVLLPSSAVAWIDTNYIKHVIPSLDIFNSYGFKWKNVRNFDSASLDDYTNVPLNRLMVSNGGQHYLATLGKRLSVSTSAYSASQYNFSATPKTLLSDKLIASLTAGSPLTQFIQGSSSTVYKVDNGQKHPISSPSSLFAHGGSWSSITKVADAFLSSLPTGSTY